MSESMCVRLPTQDPEESMDNNPLMQQVHFQKEGRFVYVVSKVDANESFDQFLERFFIGEKQAWMSGPLYVQLYAFFMYRPEAIDLYFRMYKSPFLKDYFVSKSKHHVAYLSPSNDKTFRDTQTNKTEGKGQWLCRSIGVKDEWIGLTPDGPLRLQLSEWKKRLSALLSRSP